jgi:hypothetical protein
MQFGNKVLLCEEIALEVERVSVTDPRFRFARCVRLGECLVHQRGRVSQWPRLVDLPARDHDAETRTEMVDEPTLPGHLTLYEVEIDVLHLAMGAEVDSIKAGSDTYVERVVKQNHRASDARRLEQVEDVPPNARGGVVAVDEREIDVHTTRGELPEDLRQRHMAVPDVERDVREAGRRQVWMALEVECVYAFAARADRLETAAPIAPDLD